MAIGLIPCPGCRRHVRVTEMACPFCSAGLPRDGASVRPAVTSRLSRAALVALGTTLAACGSTTTSVDGATTQDSPVVDTPSGSDVPADRGNTGVDATGSDVAVDDGAFLVLYGPAPYDAGVRADVMNGTDAGTDAGNFAPPYGIAPGDGGGAMPLYGSPPAPPTPW